MLYYVTSTNGALKFICEGNKIYKVTQSAGGQNIKTFKGFIDKAGFVKDNAGKIIDRIDFATGRSIGEYGMLARSADNVSVDVFGDIVNANGEKLKLLW